MVSNILAVFQPFPLLLPLNLLKKGGNQVLIKIALIKVMYLEMDMGPISRGDCWIKAKAGADALKPSLQQTISKDPQGHDGREVLIDLATTFFDMSIEEQYVSMASLDCLRTLDKPDKARKR